MRNRARRYLRRGCPSAPGLMAAALVGMAPRTSHRALSPRRVFRRGAQGRCRRAHLLADESAGHLETHLWGARISLQIGSPR